MTEFMERPYVLYVAEKIYLEVVKIKNKNPDLSNLDAMDTFIGSETYNYISSGKFHDEWFNELEQNNFIDKKTKRKFQKKLLDYLMFKKI